MSIATQVLASSQQTEPSISTAPVEAAVHQSKNADDDLGFDPFHETQKALAEMLEKESISTLSNGLSYNNNVGAGGIAGIHQPFTGAHMQSLYSNPSAPPPLSRHSPSTSRFNSLGSLGLGLGVGIAPQPQQPQPSRTRVPPPGFTPSQHLAGSMTQSGMAASYGLNLPNRPVNRPDMGTSKMLPFMNNHGAATANGSAVGYSNNGPRLYHDAPSMGGLGMSGLGMGSSGLGMPPSNYIGGQNGSLSHLPTTVKPQGYGMGIGANMPYPNGSGNHSGGSGVLGGDPSSTMKDWQDGLRALFPNVNISMGNGGLTGSNGSGGGNNSRLGAFPPGLSSIGNGHLHGHQQPQHHHHHQLHGALPPMGAQPTGSSHSLGGKGWRTSASSSDWTSLDPAIVSSGGITDSRSDSPPHWLRSLEQLTETGNSPAAAHPHSSAAGIHGSSSLFGLVGSTHYGLPSSLTSRGGGSSNSSSNSNTPGLDASALNSMGSFWPPSVSHATAPSMPPPGFSHIRPSPKTAATVEAHKLDSKSCSSSSTCSSLIELQ